MLTFSLRLLPLMILLIALWSGWIEVALVMSDEVLLMD